MRIRIAALLTSAFLFTALAASPAHWVVTWGASPAPQLADREQMRSAKLVFSNQTLREIIHTSIGSDTVRVRLSNAYGREPVEIGGASISLRSNDSSVVAGSS